MSEAATKKVNQTSWLLEELHWEKPLIEGVDPILLYTALSEQKSEISFIKIALRHSSLMGWPLTPKARTPTWNNIAKTIYLITAFYSKNLNAKNNSEQKFKYRDR